MVPFQLCWSNSLDTSVPQSWHRYYDERICKIWRRLQKVLTLCWKCLLETRVDTTCLQYCQSSAKLPVIQSFGRLVIQSFGHSVMRSFGHAIILSFGHSILQSFGHAIILSFSHLVIKSLGQLLILSFIYLVIQSSCLQHWHPRINRWTIY